MANRVSQVKIGVGFDVEQKGIASLRKELTNIQKMSAQTYKKLSGKDLSTDAAQRQLKQVQKVAVDVEKAVNSAFNAKLNTVNIEKFKEKLNETGLSWSKVYDSFMQAGPAGERAFNSLTNKVLSTNAQLKQTQGTLDKIATTLGNSIKWTVASTIVNGFSNSVQQAFGYVKSLDSSLNNIRIVTGKTAEQMANFAVQANQAAKAFGASTTDYTDAALIYAQQGLSDAQVAARTEVTLKTANVTKQSAAAVSQELTAVWNGFKINADQAQLAVDKLAAVAKSSASDLQELATGMSKVASAAAAMGTTEDQLAAQISTIISVTRQAPETVGAALKTFYARISDIQAGLDEEGVTLGLYSGKMKELGVDVLDINGKLRDQGEVVEEIGNRWSTFSREQQVALAQTMGGQRQYSNLIALFDNFDHYNRMLEISKNATGELEQEQAIYMESTSAHLMQMKAAMEGFQDSLIDADSIKAGADALAGLATIAEDFLDSIGGGVGLFQSLTSIAVSLFSSQISKGINNWITNFQNGKRKAEEFILKLNQVDEVARGVSNEDEITQKNLQYRKDAMNLTSVMSEKEYNQVQERLQELIQAENKIKQIEAESAIIKANLFKFSEEDSVEDVVLARSYLEELKKTIEQQAKSYEEIQLKAGKTFKQINYNFNKETEQQIKELERRIRERNKILDTATKHSDVQKRTSESQAEKERQAEIAYKEIEAYEKRIEKLKKKSKEEISQLTTDIKKSALAESVKASQQLSAQLLEKVKNDPKFQEYKDQLEKLHEALLIPIKGKDKDGKPINRMTEEQLNAYVENYNTTVKRIKEINNKIVQQFAEARAQIDNQTGEHDNNAEQAKRAYEAELKAQQQAQAALESARRAAQIKKVTDFIGGTAQLVNVISQVRNLSKVINSNLKPVQKMTQVITNLTLTVPMFISGIKKMSDSLGGLPIVFGKAAEKAGEATVKFQAFGTTLAINPITAAITALTLLAGAFSTVVGAIQEARQAEIEEAKTNIEKQQKIQEELKSNKQLADSLQELQNKYKNNQITRSQLKDSIEEIIKQHNLEAESVKKLRDSYLDLDNYISGERNYLDKEMGRSLQAQKDNAARALQREAAGNFDEFGMNTIKANEDKTQYQATHFFSYDDIKSDNYTQEQINKLKNLGISLYQIDPQINTFGQTKSEAFYKQLQNLVAARDILIEKYKNQEGLLEEDRLYQAILNRLKQNEELYTAYKEANKQNEDWLIGQAIETSKANFKEVKNFAEYQKARDEAIKAIIQAAEKNPENIHKQGENWQKERVDLYLSNQFGDLYTKYGGAVQKFIEQIESKFNLTTSQKNTISNFDDNKLNLLINGIGSQAINSFINFDNILHDIDNIDFSNLNNALQQDNFEQAHELASSKYSLLNSLNEQVQAGKTVSTSEMKNLTEGLPKEELEQITQYFDRMANGSYKMTGNLKEFSEIIRTLELKDFQQIALHLQDSIDLNSQLKQQGIDYNSASKFDKIDNVYEISKGSPVINQDNVNQQLKLLQILGQQDVTLELQVKNWKDLVKQNELSIEQAKKIGQIYSDNLSKIRNLKDVAELKEQQVKLWQQMYDAMFPTDADVDTKILAQLTEQIQNAAKAESELGQVLSDDLSGNARVAEDVAQSFMRFGAAISKVQKNYQNWNALLSDDNISNHAQIINDLRDAYADLMDMPSGKALSQEFLASAENLNLMKAALDGDVQSYNQLLEAAQQDIIKQVQIQMNPEQLATFNQQIANIQDFLLNEMPDLEVGADLTGIDGFIDKLNTIIEAAHMTAEQATAYLASMGIDAEVVQEETNATESNEISGFTSTFKEVTAPFAAPVATVSGIPGLPAAFETKTIDKGYLAQSLAVEPVTQPLKTEKQNKAFAVRVKAAHKAAGGQIKHKNSVRSDTPKASKSSKSPKSGGGGKGSGSKPDTSKKDLNKPIKDTRDKYHEVNIELSQIGKTLDRTAKNQDKVYGKGFLKNLEKQVELYKLQAKTLKDKLKIHQKDVAEQKKELEAVGAVFDEYGNMLNYQTLVGKKQDEINKLLEAQNEIIKEYNATTDSEAKKAINERLEEAKKKTKKAQDELSDLTSKIGNYDKARQDAESTADAWAEAFQKQFELRIQAFNYKIQLHLNLGELFREYNDFATTIAKTRKNVFKRTDYDELRADTESAINNISSYFDSQEISTLSVALKSIQTSINNIRNKGTDKTYGKDLNKAIEDYNNYLSQLKDSVTDIKELKDQVDEAILSNVDLAQQALNEQIEKFDSINNLLQYRLDLTALIYGDKSYNKMSKYYSQMNKNNKNQLQTLKQTTKYWKELYESSKSTGKPELIKKYEQYYKESLENLNSYIQESINTLYDSYSNEINRLIDNMDKTITNNKGGTDYLNKSWELMKQNERDYLDTINSAFAIQETRNKYQKAIDETALKNQKALKQLMNQQLKILQEKNKLSQYDVDRATKLLELEQARIALQDARNNKTTMRLKRDSQGNYSYEYVADANSIDEAESEYAKKRQDLYNFDKQRYETNLETTKSRWESFKQQISDIYLNEKDADERKRRLQLVVNQYSQGFKDLVEENKSVRENLKQIAYEDYVALYGSTTETVDQIAKKIIPNWESGIQDIITTIANTEGGFKSFWEKQKTQKGGFLDTLNSFKEATKQLKDYGKDLSIQDIYKIESLEKVIKANDELTASLQAQRSTLEVIRGDMVDLLNDQKQAINNAKKLVDNSYDYITKLNLEEIKEEQLGIYNAASYKNLIKNIVGYNYFTKQGNEWGANDKIIKSTLESIIGKNNIEQWWEYYKEIQSSTKFKDSDKTYYQKFNPDRFKKIMGFSTGGYTGDWAENNGALAILHQKELVLNQEDTKNLLDAIKIMRTVLYTIDLSAFERKIDGFKNNFNVNSGDNIEQTVHINANFPNVNSSKQIENAFNNLVNLAAQHVLKK